jgi:hypothetical protein
MQNLLNMLYNKAIRRNLMGELINLQEYKDLKEEKENDILDQEIKILKQEIEIMLDEMKDDYAPMMFYDGYKDLMPIMSRITSTLNGYYNSEKIDEEG